jgi:hypothetical protein
MRDWGPPSSTNSCSPQKRLEAGKIALKGGSADVIVSDWTWVAREQAFGDGLVYYPHLSTLGAVMVSAQSSISTTVPPSPHAKCARSHALSIRGGMGKMGGSSTLRPAAWRASTNSL